MTFSWLRSRRFWLLTAAVAGAVVIGSQLPLDEWFTAVNAGLQGLGFWAAPAFVLVYLIATVLGLPNILLILVAGSLFGLFKGALVASIADILGAIACFLIGRTFARDRIKRWVQRNPKFVRIDQAVERNGWKILLLTRLSPLVPSSILNYGFSCTKVKFWQYTFFSWIGMVPVILLYTYLGSFGTSLLSDEVTPENLLLQGFGLLLALGAALYTTRLVRKALIPQYPMDEEAAEQETTAQASEAKPSSSDRS
ncbi:TVP38/TMEM64 family protein [Nodosilinea sp. PGN35]|uniref:TVP38/TMEM64 family protein n=1 Tax=Nodosilinea sp. PGN35 TaxID=3020489 RepID=UPI0023B35255|nr:TVP38/TMEM64 family protein [Nodosilinea sp. TSF1-S3]MDF0368645.1 TVP38/TMEM64 family protein [Nodosilinea sp. TSF1-S3]